MPKSYKGVVIEGATFPDDTYHTVPIKLGISMNTEYLPALDRALPNETRGMKLFCTSFAYIEGFHAGPPPSRSYRTKNPGNVGNTDNGTNIVINTLEDGIRKQAKFFHDIANGLSNHYPLNHDIILSTPHSAEIAANPKTYGNISADPPTYHFHFTGQLDQFTKIYSTGSRSTNVYINTIISYFALNGITISPTTTLQEIIAIK